MVKLLQQQQSSYNILILCHYYYHYMFFFQCSFRSSHEVVNQVRSTCDVESPREERNAVIGNVSIGVIHEMELVPPSPARSTTSSDSANVRTTSYCTPASIPSRHRKSSMLAWRRPHLLFSPPSSI